VSTIGTPVGAINAPATVGAVAADTSRLSGKENLEKAGQQFETVFTGMMLKSMRQAKLSDPLFDSKALDTFRDMQDQTTVKAMAENTPIGIGKAMTAFLERGMPKAVDPAQQPNLNPTDPTGGR
jgi:flagellar protein FlgJ